ncbi:MAG TPA: ABC transporter permease [Aggregatilineales bacterium]|nr:ABC transporter permease [Chloroflexota bacterium]HOA22526.1 ABC transporter permease [Aggregatilineales bacterium]HPV07531.1 ABC transporter permease [Aggregatilineales bacterium]HQA68262.1 ABC transporter permease [Aggregatilineales bacterium]
MSVNDTEFVRILASIMAQSAPLLLAVTGETITERAGVINLSLDGSMMFSAMGGFVVAYVVGGRLTDAGITGHFLPVMAGLAVAALLGALVALLIAWGSIRLKRDQVAIGFVLTMLLTSMANFLGQGFTRLPGPRVKHMPIPILSDIPVLGPMLFRHDLLIYFSFLVVIAAWWWMYRTQPGLQMRGVGERPEAAFVRGITVNRVRYLYTAIGGALVGLGGAAYSLDIKIGWSDNHILGIGWIALAIVIFGGWRPFRAAFGAILYGITRALAQVLQTSFPAVPVVLFNSLQWLLMLGVLLLVGSDAIHRLILLAPKWAQRPLGNLLRVAPPAGLGTAFIEE